MGLHYPHPVELIDIYKTLNDILGLPKSRKSICRQGDICHHLQGKSLAPIVLGPLWNQTLDEKKALKKSTSSSGLGFISNLFAGANKPSSYNSHPSQANFKVANISAFKLDIDFALSQKWQCAFKRDVEAEEAKLSQDHENLKLDTSRRSIWRDCDKTKNGTDEISLMGYSMRSLEYRYTAWFHFNRLQALPILDSPPYTEEVSFLFIFLNFIFFYFPNFFLVLIMIPFVAL